MVRARLQVKITSRRNKGDLLIPFATHLFYNSELRDDYRECLLQKLMETPHDSECTAERNWESLKSGILQAGEEKVGRAKKTQPDWFLESSETLYPLIEAKNKAHKRMIQSNTTTNCKEFRKYQRLVKEAVDTAKEEWIRRTALEVELTQKDGKSNWKSIRKLQMAHAGRRSSRSTAVLKENGELTKSPEEVRSRWHRHFTKILNIPSEVCEHVVNNMSSLPSRLDLDLPPTEEELESALGKLKKGKAGGKTGIPPELIAYGGAELWDRLIELMLVSLGGNESFK